MSGLEPGGPGACLSKRPGPRSRTATPARRLRRPDRDCEPIPVLPPIRRTGRREGAPEKATPDLPDAAGKHTPIRAQTVPTLIVVNKNKPECF